MTATEAANEPWQFDRCVKDLDVEEAVDLYLHRRLAFWLVIKPIEKLGLTFVTPMQLTLLSITIGVLAGYVSGLGAERGPMMCVYGAALLLVNVILDCSDGMLARLRGGGTRLGMLVDGMGDGIVGVAYWAGISRTIAADRHEVWVWPALVAILFSIGAHTSLYDGIKTKFVAATTPKPEGDRRPENPGTAQQSQTEKKIEAWIERLYTIYAGYGSTVGKIDRSRDVAAPDVDRARAALRPAMRSMTWIGLGTSLFTMYVSAAFMPIWPLAPLYVGGIGLAGIGNVVMLVALRQWKRGEASLTGSTLS